MSAPHFRSDPACSAAFDARLERAIPDPAGAVRMAHARGYRVDETDVAVPFSDQLASLSGVAAATFRLSHAAELQNEAQAIRLARASSAILTARTGTATARAVAEREQAIEKRTADILLAEDDARRARARAQAVAEIDGITTTNTTEAARPKRRAS